MLYVVCASAAAPKPCVQVPPQVSAAPEQPAATQEKSASQAAAAVQASKPVVTALGKDQVVPIVGIRKAMTKAMTRAQQIPHFGYDDEVCGVCCIHCQIMTVSCSYISLKC